MMKSLEDVKADMSKLYEDVRERDYDLRRALTLSHIANAFLRACEAEIARGGSHGGR